MGQRKRNKVYDLYTLSEKTSMEVIALNFEDVTTPYNITGLESNTEYTVVVEAYTQWGVPTGV